MQDRTLSGLYVNPASLGDPADTAVYFAIPSPADAVPVTQSTPSSVTNPNVIQGHRPAAAGVQLPVGGSVISASSGAVLYSHDFSADTQVNSANWAFTPYQAVDDPSYLGRTQIRQSLPSIENGAAHLTIDTYNPTGAGQSFFGTAIYTRESFTDTSSGILFQAVAKLDQTQTGLVGGIFPYNPLDDVEPGPENTDVEYHDEIDTELVSNHPGTLSVNNYADEPFGAGHPQTLPLSGFSLTDWHTYGMEWKPNDIRWFVDGVQVAEATNNIPAGPLHFYLNFWVPGGGADGWAYAYDSSLQPTTMPGSTFGFDVASVLVATMCFVAGTRIATPCGDINVELLRIGDRVCIARGQRLADIVSVTRRRVDCTNHPKPETVWPVRIARHTFGENRPYRDLLLSPDHAVYLGNALIPTKYLINGDTVVQVPTNSVTYYHVELPTHDVLLADGLPVESCLDLGAGAVLQRDAVMRVWEAQGCAPLVVAGAELEAIRRQIGYTIFASNGGTKSGASNSTTHTSGSNRTCRSTYASTAA